MANVAVVYYSSTGNVHALAEAMALGATEAGAEVRLRRVAEPAPAEAIDSNPAWRADLQATAGIPEATHDDLRWADAYAAGGNPYGVAHPAGDGGPGADALAAARHQGERLARIGRLLRAEDPELVGAAR